VRDQWLPDQDVIDRVLAGDLAAFEHVMRRYNQRIYRVVRAIVKNNAEAEDVMQEAYVNALTHLSDFAGRARFSTWLTRIAMHEAFARVRSHQRQRSFEANMTEPESNSPTVTPEQSASDGELRGLLEHAVSLLPEHFRLVFVLRDVQQLSVAETAETLDIPAETVKTRLHRARGLLRDQLSERIDATLPSILEFQGARCNRIVASVLRRITT
jgi:RNA polymerase sigma-70 factor (ECF subfamily)